MEKGFLVLVLLQKVLKCSFYSAYVFRKINLLYGMVTMLLKQASKEGEKGEKKPPRNKIKKVWRSKK